MMIQIKRFIAILTFISISQLQAQIPSGPDTIPVIFHILHGGQAVGTGNNIPAGQVKSQLRILNKDFAGAGYGVYQAPPSLPPANTQIVFVPALYDPSGNLLAEPGIDRVNFNAMGWNDPASSSYSTLPAFQTYLEGTIMHQGNWTPALYCNIWVSDANSGLGLFGLGEFPDSTLLPWPTPHNADPQVRGLWVWNKTFGDTGNVMSPYNLGRSATHEMGHFFDFLTHSQNLPVREVFTPHYAPGFQN
jgi:hypothetical protein